MSKDLLIRGGSVVDGTGAPARRADVRVRQGRITEVGASLKPDGEATIDASGAYVTPGFIDTHAHMDPQVFWDPYLDPEPLHGVTTALIGNCSLSLYPVRDDTRGPISDLFAYIEDVPRYLFDENVPWGWTDFAGYRDAVNARGTGVNLASLVGHSPIRLYVMGDDAWHRAATPGEIAQMVALMRDAMADGAWGLSTSFLDVDAQGRPVPSRYADDAEFAALLDEVKGRGMLEFVPALLDADPEVGMERLANLCGERGIPLTWTGFTYTDSTPSRTQFWLDYTAKKRAEGVKLFPQLSPRTVDFRLNWDSSMMFMSMPKGWHQIINARGDEKAALLRDSGWRDIARAEWDETERAMFPHRRPELVRFVEVTKGNEAWLGRSLAELSRATGKHLSDAFADFVLANECRPGVVAVGVTNSNIEGVSATLANPDVLISSSDAGAHAQMLCASGDTTLVLTRHVRERGDFTLEQAIHELTQRQADAFGFQGRGVVAPGNAADLVVFDLAELSYAPEQFVNDLPRDGARQRRSAGGYRATVIDGVPVQVDGKLTGALPGRMLASGQ